MYYVLQDLSQKDALLTRKIKLGDVNATVSKGCLYTNDIVYMLPQELGTYTIAGKIFVRTTKGVLMEC